MAPVEVKGTLGERFTETGRCRIVEAAEVGAEFGGPFFLTIHPAQFLGPHGQVSALYCAEVAQPWTGHDREHVGPPAAPSFQPCTRTLDAFAGGLHDGCEGRAADARRSSEPRAPHGWPHAQLDMAVPGQAPESSADSVAPFHDRWGTSWRCGVLDAERPPLDLGASRNGHRGNPAGKPGDCPDALVACEK